MAMFEISTQSIDRGKLIYWLVDNIGEVISLPDRNHLDYVYIFGVDWSITEILTIAKHKKHLYDPVYRIFLPNEELKTQMLLALI